MWRNSDPRYFINKRADIIIYRADLCKACFAQVDTKEVYCVFTPWDGYKNIDADENWNPDWYWAFAPGTEYKNIIID